MTLQFFNALRYRALPAVENVHAVKQAAGIGRTFEQIYCFLPGIEFIFRHDDDRPQAFIDNADGFTVIQDGSQRRGYGLPRGGA